MENNAYYISLTRGMSGYYIKVLATDSNVARGYADNYYANNWCSVYVEEEIEELIMKGYKTIIINENDPVVLNDSSEWR